MKFIHIVESHTINKIRKDVDLLEEHSLEKSDRVQSDAP